VDLEYLPVSKYESILGQESPQGAEYAYILASLANSVRWVKR